MRVIALHARGVSALDVPANPDAAQRRWAVPVEATVTVSPPEITLHFLDATDNLPYEVRRRAHGDVAWSPVLASLPAGAIEWTDVAVSPGVIFEYQVRKDLGAEETAFGYVVAGIDVDVTGERGRVLVVVDETLRDPLGTEIDRLLEDLAGDGWLPVEVATARGAGWDDSVGAVSLRTTLSAAWTSFPPAERPSHLFLLGHLPVARSGLDAFAPDGHDENRGALAADAFFADIDGVWTDVGTAPPGVSPEHANVPGDGRYDQDFLPSELEMAFGRVDFADIEGQPGETEVDVFRRYLDRDHAYRHVAAGAVAGERVAFVNGFIESVEMGWRTFPGIAGAGSTEFLEFADVNAAGGPVAFVNTFGPYALFAQNQFVPNLTQHRDQGTNALLWSSDQSFFGYWDVPSSHIRSLLATPGINLAWVWEVSPSYVFADLAMGATLGEAVRRTAEHSPTNLLFERPEREYDDAQVWNRQFITLLGDPTLRLFQVPPPADLVAGAAAGGGHQLDWTASPATDLVGYHVARATSPLGPFERLTNAGPTAATSWVDADAPPGFVVYRVRAVRRVTSGGGTFLNPSQGIFATVGPIFADDFESGDTSAWSSTVKLSESDRAVALGVVQESRLQ